MEPPSSARSDLSLSQHGRQCAEHEDSTEQGRAADFRRLPSRAVPKPPTVARLFGGLLALCVGSCRALQAVCSAPKVRLAGDNLFERFARVAKANVNKASVRLQLISADLPSSLCRPSAILSGSFRLVPYKPSRAMSLVELLGSSLLAKGCAKDTSEAHLADWCRTVLSTYDAGLEECQGCRTALEHC